MVEISTEKPIFIIGAPRSGTTLLRYMLSSHPRIYIPPESNFIPRFIKRSPKEPLHKQQAIGILKAILNHDTFLKDWHAPFPDPLTFVEHLPDLRPETFFNVLYSQYAQQYGAERWGDKSPIYTSYTNLISEIFSTAQFIHILRDGRDVALSMKKAYQGANYFYMDICYAAHTWKRRVRSAVASGARIGPKRYLEVRYEELVADPEARLREICDFIGESYVPEMKEPHRMASKSYHSLGIYASTRQPLTTNHSGRWQKEMSEADRRLFQMLAGDLLEELGYEMEKLEKMSAAERVRLLKLQTKYAIVEAGRRSLQVVGIFNPTHVLSRFTKPLQLLRF